MEGKKTIRRIKLENFLSYGSEGQAIDLEPLNVLIGPNASGKSNLIEAFRFLNAIPSSDLTKPIRDGGGASEYLWKGAAGVPTATVELTVESHSRNCPLNYRISFTADNWQRLLLVEETIEYKGDCNRPLVYHYPNKDRHGVLYFENPIAAQSDKETQEVQPYLSQEVSIDANRSVLGWIRDPDRYPELAHLEHLFLNFQFAGDWQLGRYGPIRTPQRADLPTDILWEDASNLGLILNNYSNKTRQTILTMLRQVYEEIDEINTRVAGNTIQTFISEPGFSTPTPAIRLSDGTLRYLCLLTLLNQPTLPSLLCIEEPEVGMHPDVIHTIGELLIEASRRTQIIVTTHSDILVSALSEAPESVVVCERDAFGTNLQRLDPGQLKLWLEKYALGDLWRRGDLGGTRW